MPTSLPQWLPFTSKRICKWVLCLVVIRNYYGNLRVKSVTWNIGVFIAFNIAVTMIRCSGSRTNIFYWISSLAFWKVGPTRPTVLELSLNWSFIRKKFQHKCYWHLQQRMEVLSANKPQFHSRISYSRSQVFIKKAALKFFRWFARKRMFRSLFLCALYFFTFSFEAYHLIVLRLFLFIVGQHFFFYFTSFRTS